MGKAEGPAPQSEARSQAHIYRVSTWGGPSRAQSSPHIHRQSLPHPLRHPGGPHIQLRTQEMEFKGMRREEGGRSGKAQEKATTESLSWERGRRNPPEGR